MAGTLGNFANHDQASAALTRIAKDIVNLYINNEINLGDLQYCLGDAALQTAAGIDLVAHPEDGTLINNMIAALTQIKATLEGTAPGSVNIVQLCAQIKGL